MITLGLHGTATANEYHITNLGTAYVELAPEYVGIDGVLIKAASSGNSIYVYVLKSSDPADPTAFTASSRMHWEVTPGGNPVVVPCRGMGVAAVSIPANTPYDRVFIAGSAANTIITARALSGSNDRVI